MKREKDYASDIAEIRAMMERSSKYLSLSGWAGILAGIYALVTAYILHVLLKFAPTGAIYHFNESTSHDLSQVILLALALLFLSIATAIVLSWKRSIKRNEKNWNPTSRRLVIGMALPLLSGGALCVIFTYLQLIGLLPSLTLIFYGLSLFSAGNFTYREVRTLGILQILLGLCAAILIPFSLLFWAAGFGLLHIIYGLYIHLKHER